MKPSPITPATRFAIEQGRVRESNRRFYQIVENLNLDEMAEVWLTTPNCRCVHPGGPLLVGWDAVREGWRLLFESVNDLRIELSRLEVHMEGPVAWVTCLERMTRTTATGVDHPVYTASNCFVLHEGEWKLAQHHSSPQATESSHSARLAQ